MSHREPCCDSSSQRARSYRIHRRRPGALALWTLKPLQVWETLRREGELLVDPALIAHLEDYREAYDWMRGQMALRLPRYGGHYPWWAYDYKLDLRLQRFHYGAQGERWVRIELAMPKEDVLLSAYGDWHFVLNRWYYPNTTDEAEHEAQSDAWDAELERHGIDPYHANPLPEPWESRLRQSWEGIFDVDELRETNTIQATFERLKLAHVVAVTEFTSQAKSW